MLILLIALDGYLFTGFHQLWDYITDHPFFLFDEMTKHRHWEFIKSYGSVWTAVVAWIVISKFDPHKRRLFWRFLFAILISTLAYTVLKHIIGKIRPEANDWQPFYYPLFLGWNLDGGMAFPSGHATFAFAFATCMALFYPQLRHLFYTLAALCALSRVISQAHFFSDIYAGALLGCGVMSGMMKPSLIQPSKGLEKKAHCDSISQADNLSMAPLFFVKPFNPNATQNPIDISIVIPVMNEEENITLLADEIDRALASFSWTFEVIWVNDGSNDRTPQLLDALHNNHPVHVPLHLPHNMGQSAAMWAGFRYSRGAIVVTLDGDRQNDPQDIPKLVQHVLSGETDVANGYRVQRQDVFQRRIASRIANRFRNSVTGKTVRDVGCSIRAMRRECLEHLPLFHGMHRFLPTIFKMQGFRIDEQPVNHRLREHGKTKYTINKRLWVGLYDVFGIIWLRHRGLYHNLPHLSASNPHHSNEANTMQESSVHKDESELVSVSKEDSDIR